MIGTLINQLFPSRSAQRDGDSMLLSRTEFNREVARERIRATRRSIPFCVITIELHSGKQLRLRRRRLIRILHRDVRLTDQKADLGGNRFGVLLVDTPEMGGRAALDRLTSLCDVKQLHATLSFRVHDPEGFDDDDVDPGLPTREGGRRRGDRDEAAWMRIDNAIDRTVSEESNLAIATRRPPRSQPPQAQPETRLRDEACFSSEAVVAERSSAHRLVKRAIDLTGASVGLVLASPILVCAAVAIRLTSPGPAFFKQTREGMGGKPFTIYKLRTMVVDAERRQSEFHAANHRDGPAFKIRKDPRVTRVGHFLRKTCVDELPQLVNVIRGDMSLVGPRPLPWHESRACRQWHRRRLDVLPGLTCHWQVNKTSAPTFDDWMRMDLRYVDRNSILEDLGLLARTVVVPMTGRGSD